METYKVIISPTAEEDLHNIFKYIQNEFKSLTTAITIYNELYELIFSLETFPSRGSIRRVGQYKHKGYRQLFYKNHTIVYDVNSTNNVVNIVTIQYSPRNF